jgi:hypothetical protein
MTVSLPNTMMPGRYQCAVQFAHLSEAYPVYFDYSVHRPPMHLDFTPSSGPTNTPMTLQTRNIDLSIPYPGIKVFFVETDYQTQQVRAVEASWITLASDALQVSVPAMSCDTCGDVYDLDVIMQTPLGNVSGRNTFTWQAPIMPEKAGPIQPSEGSSHGRFQVHGSLWVARSDVSISGPSVSDFLLSLGGVPIPIFRLTFEKTPNSALQDDMMLVGMEFEAPPALPVGFTNVTVTLAQPALTFKSIVWDFDVYQAGAPYVNGELNPNYCYTDGGGTASARISDFPESIDVKQLRVEFQHTNVTAAVRREELRTNLVLDFPIPANAASSSLKQEVTIHLPTVPVSVLKTHFEYKALPSPELRQQPFQPVQYTGGEEVR